MRLLALIAAGYDCAAVFGYKNNMFIHRTVKYNRGQAMNTHNLISRISTLAIDDILSMWVKQFCLYGIHPPQVDIMFDSFQERDDGTMDDSQLCFAVFIHKHSGQPNFEFPEHDYAWGYVTHLPFDQACFPVWLDIKQNTTIVCDPMTELCMADMDYIIHQIEYLRQIGQPQIHTRENLDQK